MPKFTVQVEYLLPVYKNVDVTANSAKEAAELALLDDDWDNAKQGYDGATATYVAAIWEGHGADYTGKAVAIPDGVPMAP